MMLPFDFTGRTAVVTGGSRGIGRATAVLLAQAGADVAITFLNRRADAERTLSDIRAAGVRGMAIESNLTQSAVAASVLDEVGRAFGRVDFFIGNAGTWEPTYVSAGDLTETQWRHTLAANLDSVFFCIKAAIPRLVDGGRVVLVSSTAGQRGEAGHVDYAASKGAIISMVKGLAVEVGQRGITVNAVAPGWVSTEMAAPALNGGGLVRIAEAIPLGRVAAPEDVAGPIVFLCSPLARHITGEILNVNGGAVLCG